MDPSACWQVQGKRDLPALIQALSDLLPEGSSLYLEGGEHSKHLKAFLEARSGTPRSKVAMGTIWPRPKVYHAPADKAFLEELAEQAKNYAEPEICFHLHVYKNDEILIEGYDFDDRHTPFYVSKRIPEEKLGAFCARLGLTYRELDSGQVR